MNGAIEPGRWASAFNQDLSQPREVTDCHAI